MPLTAPNTCHSLKYTQGLASLPAVATRKKEDDELCKPSLLYPGKTFEKALSKGPRSLFEIQDGEEKRDYRWYQSKIAKFMDRGLVREALQLYVVGMKLENRLEPSFHTYRYRRIQRTGDDGVILLT